jgi:hypothetical protein
VTHPGGFKEKSCYADIWGIIVFNNSKYNTTSHICNFNWLFMEYL